MTPTTYTSKFVVHCQCGHEWVAAHLPMTVDNLAKVMRRIHCPKCASPKVFCGPAVGIASGTLELHMGVGQSPEVGK